MKDLRRLNPVLAFVGLGIRELRIGHWYIGRGGQIQRSTFHWKWQLTSRRAAAKAVDGETAMDRFIRNHFDA